MAAVPVMALDASSAGDPAIGRNFGAAALVVVARRSPHVEVS